MRFRRLRALLAPGEPRRPDPRRFAAGEALLITLSVLACISNDLYDHRSYGWIIDVALALPLFFRRRWPAAVFGGMVAVCLAQWLSGYPASGDILVLLSIQALGAYERRRWVLVAAGAGTAIGMVVATLRWAPVDHRLTTLILLTGTVAAAWVAGVYVRTRRAYLESILERATTAERDRDLQAQVAVAAERSRIAREMHDIIAHSLSVIIALSDGAVAGADREPREAKQSMRQASTVGRQALAEMRRLLGVMRTEADPDLAPQPGAVELDELIERVRSAGLAVDVTVSGERRGTPPSAELAVYRIVQESLTNVLKHARQPERTHVTIRYEPGGIDVEVANEDRAPLSGGATDDCRGHGLDGIRERAAVFNGVVESGRRPDGSWHVLAHLQLAESRSSS